MALSVFFSLIYLSFVYVKTQSPKDLECRPGVNFTMDCIDCYCVSSSAVACNWFYCNRDCVPGAKWTEGCNKCECFEFNGTHSYCEDNGC